MRRRLAAFLASLAAAVLITSRVVRAPDAYRASWTDPRSGIELVLISAGTFQMGTPASEAGREAQEVPHGVRLSRPFYLARHEVTQEPSRTEAWA